MKHVLTTTDSKVIAAVMAEPLFFSTAHCYVEINITSHHGVCRFCQGLLFPSLARFSTCTFAFSRVLVGTQDTCEVKEVKKAREAKEMIEAG